ncbi:hypothetical protein HYR54_14905 [Candidatus Acetothermia bacterium]|nr:hypothetical protein [Candidatus Acetothermia bacterium]
MPMDGFTDEELALIKRWRQRNAIDPNRLISEETARAILDEIKRLGGMPRRLHNRVQTRSHYDRPSNGSPSGKVRPQDLRHRDTSVKHFEKDPAPQVDLGKDFAGIGHASDIWLEVKSQQASEDSPDEFSFLDAYEHIAAENIKNFGQVEGPETYETRGERSVQQINDAWVLDEYEHQSAINMEFFGNPHPDPGTPLVPELEYLGPQSMLDDPMRPPWFQETIQQPMLEEEQEL